MVLGHSGGCSWGATDQEDLLSNAIMALKGPIGEQVVWILSQVVFSLFLAQGTRLRLLSAEEEGGDPSWRQLGRETI